MDVLTIILGVIALLAIAAVIKLSADKAALSARLDAQKEAQKQLDEQREASIKEQKDQAAKSLEEMRNAFKALSAENSEHFRKASAESVGELLKPSQEKFKEFSKKKLYCIVGYLKERNVYRSDETDANVTKLLEGVNNGMRKYINSGLVELDESLRERLKVFIDGKIETCVAG